MTQTAARANSNDDAWTRSEYLELLSEVDKQLPRVVWSDLMPFKRRLNKLDWSKMQLTLSCGMRSVDECRQKFESLILTKTRKARSLSEIVAGLQWEFSNKAQSAFAKYESKAKRPVSAYLRYSQELVPKLIEKHPNKSTVWAVRRVAKKWQELDPVEKERYNQLFKSETSAYKQEMSGVKSGHFLGQDEAVSATLSQQQLIAYAAGIFAAKKVQKILQKDPEGNRDHLLIKYKERFMADDFDNSKKMSYIEQAKSVVSTATASVAAAANGHSAAQMKAKTKRRISPWLAFSKNRMAGGQFGNMPNIAAEWRSLSASQKQNWAREADKINAKRGITAADENKLTKKRKSYVPETSSSNKAAVKKVKLETSINPKQNFVEMEESSKKSSHKKTLTTTPGEDFDGEDEEEVQSASEASSAQPTKRHNGKKVTATEVASAKHHKSLTHESLIKSRRNVSDEEVDQEELEEKSISKGKRKEIAAVKSSSSGFHAFFQSSSKKTQ